jgi:RNA polymerase sigma-70 factor (ECF subfamily)
MGDSESSSYEADRQALFEQEVFPLQGSLYRMAYRLTRDNADAEDLVQDTMIKAYQNMDSYQPETHVMAWLVRIMQHRFIDNHRRRQRRPPEYLTGDINDWERYAHNYHASAGDTVESHFAVCTMTTLVRAAVKQLPEELRFAVYYAYVEGRQYKEIARLQRVPVGTVMSRLYRARRQLRDLLTEWVPTNYSDTQTDSATRCPTNLCTERPERRANRCADIQPCGQ